MLCSPLAQRVLNNAAVRLLQTTHHAAETAALQRVKQQLGVGQQRLPCPATQQTGFPKPAPASALLRWEMASLKCECPMRVHALCWGNGALQLPASSWLPTERTYPPNERDPHQRCRSGAG